ncbi:hypothetical protein EON82_04965 [bacterium]|nr:MAG: hypothetical protein EON82_04965 [bacterium]
MPLLPFFAALAFRQDPAPEQPQHVNPLARFSVVTNPIQFPPAGQTQVQEIKGIVPEIAFDDVVPCWNVYATRGAKLRIEIRVHGTGYDTAWINLGTWSGGAGSAPLVVGVGQKGNGFEFVGGRIRLARLAASMDVRLTMTTLGERPRPTMELLGFSVCNSKFFGPSKAPEKDESWGIKLPTSLPALKSTSRKESVAVCVSATLKHWSDMILTRELEATPQQILAAMPTTEGDPEENLSFAAALAGSRMGIVSYPTHFTSISDLQQWIELRIPVICELYGKNDPKRRFVLLVGFTETGSPLLLDPSKGGEAVAMPRSEFDEAWLASQRGVLLAYLSSLDTPENSRGLWIERHTAR